MQLAGFTAQDILDCTSQARRVLEHCGIRFINCEVCQTEGRIYTSNGGPDEIDNGPCPACNGECVVEVETKPCGLLTECPSCKQMFENGGQCAAPVMRGGCPMGGDF
ncbi:hypothetical protein [Bradyrhizobium sp. Arg816]|uniref:hypothetical protein n=1 Tax=Bradyrhizobium sp. Arg816 TaxID=2998491 RepID=UPI00249EE431|nr:hypothetical protein [Bradyrhizobium sp. Arg816]